MAPRERGAIRPSDLRVTKRESTKSQWVKPATIGPSVDCPRVGARSSRGAVGLSSVDLLTVYSHSAAKKSLDFQADWGATLASAMAQVRRPASTASAIRPPSPAPATMAPAQCLIHSATPCGEPVPYAASAPK